MLCHARVLMCKGKHLRQVLGSTFSSLISAGCPFGSFPLTNGFLSNPAAVASAFLPSVLSPPTGPNSHCMRSPFWDFTCTWCSFYLSASPKLAAALSPECVSEHEETDIIYSEQYIRLTTT